MAAGSVLAFWAVSLLLIVVPGADWAFTIGAGLRGRPVYPAVGGLVVGYAAITVVVATGVGALVAGEPALLTALTLAGGLYLMAHGATTAARPAAPSDPAPGAVGGGDRAVFLRGIGVSALNPKGLLIFLALLPQFTDRRGAWPIAVQIGVLGLAFVITCGLFYLGVGRLTRGVLHGRPAAARLVGRLSGIAMIGIGAWLIAGHLLGPR
ncbi:LysE family translocator [Nonomuraea rhodomycinica]|uniref:LysE family translocator n=1 Tax=Nonomuraea rhodomycinica TaxID=1712872 RepID=A0A7Y6IQ97_9ACTN|nr:LysE family translocator [Nonomuraea rhodomycinica]NUW42100.1 LysE family translocator [Nonomuraea rhodomycinica]